MDAKNADRSTLLVRNVLIHKPLPCSVPSVKYFRASGIQILIHLVALVDSFVDIPYVLIEIVNVGLSALGSRNCVKRLFGFFKLLEFNEIIAQR